jgi:hypothetical protein
MRELLFEILLRLAKAVAAAVIGVGVWLLCVGVLRAEPSATLGLLCWLSGVGFILVVQESPI